MLKYDQTIDFWSTDWFWLEKTVKGERDVSPWPVAAGLFKNCKIIYSRSDKDKQRFEEIVKKSKLDEEARIEMAISMFKTLYSYVYFLETAKKTNDIATARWAAWNVINGLVNVLGIINSKIYTKNYGSNIVQMVQLPLKPDKLEEKINVLALSTNLDEIARISKTLLQETRNILIKKQNQHKINKEKFKEELPESFIEIVAYLNKILSACKKKDILAASYSTNEIQSYIADVFEKLETGKMVDSCVFNSYDEVKGVYEKLCLPDLNNYVTRRDFDNLEKAVKKSKEMIKDFMVKKGIAIRQYTTWKEIEEFLDKKNVKNNCGGAERI